MKYHLFFITIISLLSSCTTSGQQIDLNIPDWLAVSKSSQHELFPETQLFFIRPKFFIYDKLKNGFYKDDSNFIMVFIFKNENVNDQIKGIKESIERLKKDGASSFYFKELTMNSNKAMIAYSPSDKSGLEQISMVVGNYENSYVIKGYFPAQNQKSRDEIIASFKSIIVDDSVSLEVQYKYTLDLDNSQISLNKVDGDTHYYTVKGKGDLENVDQNRIMLQTLPPMPSFEARKEYNDKMMERFRRFFVISGLAEKEIIINGLHALESTYSCSGKDNNISSMNYQLIIGNENETIFLTGIAYTEKELTVEQMRQLIKTLVLR